MFYRIQREEFTRISLAICKLFPNEAPATYYIQAQNSGSSKGKLRDAFKGLRDKYVLAGMVIRRKNNKKVKAASSGK